ncbi:MAG: hypothetical protein JWO00_283 [Candidatus Parcubacteria bacterium]|nr:hypothetical protein [Candidatus Parcubacteria bacterium]
MKTKYFFACCRDLVRTRWECVLLSRTSEISLIRADDAVAEMPLTFWHPLCAVANEVMGFRPALTSDDEWDAAKLLDLPEEVTQYIFIASMIGTNLGPYPEEVRQELIHNLCPKTYMPPLNSLPWGSAIRAA